MKRLQTCFHLPGGGDEIDQQKLIGNEHKPIIITTIFDKFIALIKAPSEGWTSENIMNLCVDNEMVCRGYDMYLGHNCIGTSEY
jgi:hypothetical protein